MATQKDKVFERVGHAEGEFAALLPLARATKQPAAARLVTTPVVATLADFDADGMPLVRADALRCEEPVVARTTVSLDRAQAGSSVLIACENGDPKLPIIIGVIATRADTQKRARIQADGERYVVEANREIVLRCGASSITLTRAGKVIIKGTYVLSRSSGYNKIKGAAVDIN